MLYAVIVVLESRARVVRRVNKHAFDLTSEFLLKRFQGE
jgi:hypothetical protein